MSYLTEQYWFQLAALNLIRYLARLDASVRYLYATIKAAITKYDRLVSLPVAHRMVTDGSAAFPGGRVAPGIPIATGSARPSLPGTRLEPGTPPPGGFGTTQRPCAENIRACGIKFCSLCFTI